MLLALARGAAARSIPAHTGWVQDEAGLLSPAVRERVRDWLGAYHQQTGHQLALLTVASLEGDALEDFTIRAMEAWQLGDKQRDDGLLLFVTTAERRIRIEVGHGLEGDVTDAASSRIINEIIQPAFRRNQMEAGLVDGLKALMAATGAPDLALPGSYGGQRARPPQRHVGGLPFGFIVALLIFSLAAGRGRRSRWGWGAGPTFYGGRGGFGGGFGSFGGGFSGGRSSGRDSGWRGGGGSFGGGGASGGW